MWTRIDPTKARLRRKKATSIGYEVICDWMQFYFFQGIIFAVGHALKILCTRCAKDTSNARVQIRK
jgi:hypothetical protein